MDPYPEFFIRAAQLRSVYDSTAEDVAAISHLLTDHGAKKVLDMPCGFGRIAGPLHGMGFEVTGVDLSDEQLSVARTDNPGPDYVQGNFLSPPDGPFDAILNVYTSFGYTESEETDQQCLAKWHSILRPSGVLVIETLDTVRVASIDDTERHLQREDGVFVRQTGDLTEHIFTDPETNIMSISYRMNGEEFTSRTRLYHRDTLRDLLRQNGFSTVDVYSSLDLAPVAPTSHTVFVAVK